jgi:large subunit ribosomal protein LX
LGFVERRHQRYRSGFDGAGTVDRTTEREERWGSYFPLARLLEAMDDFTVSGRFRARRNTWQPFETQVRAPNESVATERTYAEFGSRHGLKRMQIEIAEIAGSEEESR